MRRSGYGSENRSALAGIIAAVAVLALDVVLLFAVKPDGHVSELGAIALTLGLVALVAGNALLWFWLAARLDRLFGNRP